jgi:hypothetical protein
MIYKEKKLISQMILEESESSRSRLQHCATPTYRKKGWGRRGAELTLSSGTHSGEVTNPLLDTSINPRGQSLLSP